MDVPDNLSLDSLWTTDRTENYTISSTDIGSGTRILMYSTSNNNVSSGYGPVLNIRYLVNYNAYAGNVSITFNEVTVSDSIGGIYWISELDTGHVTIFPGYMEEPHDLVAVSGLDTEVPLSWNAPQGPIPPTVPFTVEILTDNYPGETSWDLVHVDGDSIVASIFAGELIDMATLYTWELNIPAGAHVFTIYDEYGDGICCGYGNGEYNLYLNDELIATGGQFGSSETVEFTILDDWLTMNPLSGTVSPEGSAGVLLNINAAGMYPGVYSAGISVNSNDPDQGAVIIPLSLTVISIGSF